MLDTYIHHTIVIKHDIDDLFPMATTPPYPSGISSVQRHRSVGRSPWDNGFSPFFQSESDKCNHHREDMQSTISNLRHLESLSEKNQSRKVSFMFSTVYFVCLDLC